MREIELPDGTRVRGRGLRKPVEGFTPPDFGLYLGKPRDVGPWPHEWIEWPDFLLPSDSVTARRQIRALYEKAQAGQRVEVACGGGVGRTGTVVACLAILAGTPNDAAVAWTRQHYHRWAVETPWQRRWVRSFR